MSHEQDQATLLKEAREKLELTSAELAEKLGVSLAALNNWLLPKRSKRHRLMPKTARILLSYILLEGKKGKRK